MAEELYGFNRQDTDALLREIGAEGGEVPQFRHPSGGSGVSLFRFTLTGSWSSNVANADIKQMDGTAVESSSVSDPEAIFGDLATDDTGLCIKQGGVYYVIQAPCPA